MQEANWAMAFAIALLLEGDSRFRRFMWRGLCVFTSPPEKRQRTGATTNNPDSAARKKGIASFGAGMKDRQNLRCSCLRSCGFALLPISRHKKCNL
jgi:hypothetical protein